MARESLAAGIRCATAAVVLTTAGCLSSIPQDKHSGEDFHPKGAKEIELEEGDGRSETDIVTYPGGDRVDWKQLTVPEGSGGVLKIKLKWRPPRPGLDLAFRVYDAAFGRIARAEPTPGAGKRAKTVTIDDAKPGMTYYVQVFAPRRMDAGEYRVYTRFRQTEGQKVASLDSSAARDIPDPPELPAIPTPEAEPEEEEEEEKPQPCPNDPTRMQPDCPEEEPEAEPVKARVVKYQVSSSGALIITIDRGKSAGVESGWQGQVVSSAGTPVGGGSFKVTKVTSGESIGKVKMSVDQIKANRRVILSPPE